MHSAKPARLTADHFVTDIQKVNHDAAALFTKFRRYDLVSAERLKKDKEYAAFVSRFHYSKTDKPITQEYFDRLYEKMC